MSEPKTYERIYLFEISEDNLERIIFALADSGRDDEPLYKWLVDVLYEGPWRAQAKTFGAWKMAKTTKKKEVNDE